VTSTSSATYSPGAWVAASSASAWLLVDLGLDDPRLTDCWTALAGDDADRVLDVLLGGGLAALPGFALVVSRASGTRVVARHPAVVTCRREGQEPTVVTGAEGRTWTDVELAAEYDEIALGAGDDETRPIRLPLAHGITPAGLLTVGGVAGPVVAPPVGVDEPVTGAPGDVPGPDPAEAPAPEDLAVALAPPAAQQLVEPATDDDDADLPDEATGSGDPGAGASYYGRLLGATVDRDALLAELADDEEDEAEGGSAESEIPPVASGHTAIWQAEPAPDALVDEDAPAAAAEPEQPVATNAHTPPPTSSGGLIDGVPWATGSTAPPGPPPPPPAEPTPVVASPAFKAPAPAWQPQTTPVPDVDPAPATASEAASYDASGGTSETEVRTVNRAELLKSLAAPATTGPTVMAVRCPRSHLTSAYSAHCRVCGDAIEDQLPTEEPRPALGRLLLSTGETVILDRDVILGRAPESAEEDPALRPNLVQLTDSGEVSRTHVRVTLDGWQPMLRDLGSSNGTTLTLSSSSPQQLRPQEDYALEPGCEVSLADVVSFRFDVTE
jgi:hypothetical protein